MVLLGGPVVVRAQTVVVPAGAAPRVVFGADRLRAALAKADMGGAGGRRVIVRIMKKDSAFGEGYSIVGDGRIIHVDANDPSGALYGCLELAARIRSGGWPAHLHFRDHPEMPLRGACIGVQKPNLLPGRGPYEYPYTPENFPWFYDKAMWERYLDSMVENRMNTLYLWNGHPFASLVRLPDYPYAVEVDDATFKKNEEVFHWLATEADKRGIWLIQLFYNIIVSKPFAEHNHLKTQDRNRHIVPIIADYTRKSIAAFVEKYPNVGLMFTLGEAMEGVGQDDIDWLTKTIIPGVKDGLRALGRTDEPPLVLRAHDTDGPADMKAALPLYKNLYVEAKYNGEALTTYTPRGSWADLHRQLSHISKGLIENVHIMANLEPFRYGADDFIQNCVLAMHNVYGASGLHLYPQASYWDWPYSADSADPRLIEFDRDWIWYKEWARYAWNCHRDRQEEVAYWSGLLASRYGCDTAAGRKILIAYEQAGEIAPKLLRRFGITDGNRQTLTLGMLMTQLIDPDRFGLFTLLYESEGPPGEMLSQYAAREWRRQGHEGETPMQVVAEVREEGQRAVDVIGAAASVVTRNRVEFDRLRNDMLCYKALADCYADKATAALSVLRYKYSNDVGDLAIALPALERSLEAFRELTRLATPTYRYANSMQTPQRKIPVRGTGGKFTTWAELLPIYEEEEARFKIHLDSMRAAGNSQGVISGGGLVPAPFKAMEIGGTGTTVQLIGADGASVAPDYFGLDSRARVYADTTAVIGAVSPIFEAVKAIRQSAAQQLLQGTRLEFNNTQPVDLLIGFFNHRGAVWVQPPQLETDASANDYGQADVLIFGGFVIPGWPDVNVHRWSFPPGHHVLDLGKGMCLVLGFVQPRGKMATYNAGLNDPGNKDLDWLFE